MRKFARLRTRSCQWIADSSVWKWVAWSGCEPQAGK